MIAEAREAGRRSPTARQFAETFGFFQSGQVSLRVEDLSIIGRIMAALAPIRRSIGAVAVERIDDLLRASRATRPATCCACGSPTDRA
jgi:phosphomannomutase